MKIRKLWLSGFLVLVLFGFFMVDMAQAQLPNLIMWEGKWFKLTVKTTGLFFDGSKLKTGNDNSTNYLRIKEFHPPAELTVQVWEQNDQGGWVVFVDNLSLKIIAGTDLDFLFVTTLEINDDPQNPAFFGFAARITGRLTKEVLKSATLKSLGGFSWEQILDLNPKEYFAAGVAINGSLIDSTKLPFTPTP
ncbi:MAG TPA: hypothetical protein VLK23_18795 [Thermodesulfobacteriota bacterium]|nr:hypothetical protein [Thermodesulfobacteriota bacterium]